MQFAIRMGIPEMEEYWNDLCEREPAGALDRIEFRTFKKLLKAFHLLAGNPRHPGLNSHEIGPLSRIAGVKVWESYIENRTPAAGRIFWAYGPGRRDCHPRIRAPPGRQEESRVC